MERTTGGHALCGQAQARLHLKREHDSEQYLGAGQLSRSAMAGIAGMVGEAG